MRRVVVLGNGLVGSEVQAVGLARRLLAAAGGNAPAPPPTLVRIPPSTVARRLPNRAHVAVATHLARDPLWGFDAVAVHAALAEHRPDVVVGCGRTTAVLNRGIKTLHPTVTTVQILSPYLPLRGCGAADGFDVVVLPRHDDGGGGSGDGGGGAGAGEGAQVQWMTGSLHDKSPSVLADARAAFADELGAFPAPRVALLVGAPHRRCRYSAEALRAAADALAAGVAACGGSLIVLASRRTPAGTPAALRQVLADRACAGMVWAPGDAAPNPYTGALALSDAIVLSPDSMTMASEALSCRPVLGVSVLMRDTASGKFRRFFDGLAAATAAAETPAVDGGGRGTGLCPPWLLSVPQLTPLRSDAGVAMEGDLARIERAVALAWGRNSGDAYHG
jgi:mitochondrial fission protein ELM1